ncbi:MAG: hypothetical protein C4519_14680 [Desulfobacteraceae bacterium]|nr:MAG: hypothetical protein C4519_14680 [Desulfobacteraceae bacterium]
MLKKVFDQIHNYRYQARLPEAAKDAHHKDLRGLPETDPGADQIIRAGIAWLCRAQDRSATQDGGVARHYSLIDGWSASYPETTGYIAPTMLDYARATGEKEVRERARRMLDWLVAIQLPQGGFQGGLIDSDPVVPVTFNTGQILLGLAAGAAEFREPYFTAMCRAADWLVQTQDPDGCWRGHPTPFAAPGEKVYETHVAWGLLEAARVAPGKGYGRAALRNVRWALSHQQENGWFAKCCLTDPHRPLTHTLGYVLRGLLEAYIFTRDAALLQACRKTADGLSQALRSTDGYLPGRLTSAWQAGAPWVCLTGNSQIAYCWLKLFELTGHTPYRDAALTANRYVRRTIITDERNPDIRGAVKGSFPVGGEYGRYQYLNWACKFTIDANMLELKLIKTGQFNNNAGQNP